MFVHSKPGFRESRDEARRVVPDAFSAIFFTAFFIAVTLLAMRRPAYAVCALVAAQPFAFTQILPHTTMTLSKTALVATVLGLCAHPAAFAALRARAARPFLIAGMLVCAATLLTYVEAAYHAPVVRETLKALEYVLLFAVVFTAYRLDPDREAVRAAVLATAVAVCALALAQEIAGAHSVLLMNGHPIPRIAGPLEGPNQLAGYFDVVLPLVFAFAISAPSAAVYVALFLIVCTDVLTFSRGGALGALVAIVTVCLMARRNVRAGLATIGLGLLAGASVASVWGIAAHALGLSRFWDVSETADAGGVGRRSLLWRAAVVLWRRHPLLGIGAGNFEREIALTGVRNVRTHANSLYLQSLVEGGVPLLGATVYSIYVSIASFARNAMRSPFVLGAFAASIALAVHQIVDLLIFYPKVGAEWWLLLALAAAELT